MAEKVLLTNSQVEVKLGNQATETDDQKNGGDEEEKLKEQEVEEKETASPDGGWAWMVCLGAFIANFVVFGIHNSFGVIYSTLIIELGISSAQTAWIGSLGMGLNFFFGPISSALCERIGCRLTSLAGAVLAVSGLLLTSFITQKDVSKMYATYGVMWGVGSSFCYVSSMVILGQYFNKRMALANGLGTSGSGFGTLIMAPVIQKLLSTLGWRTTFRFLGGLSSSLLIAAWLFRPLPGRNVQNDETPHPCVDLNIWRNKAFIVWVLSISFFLFGYFIPFVHLVRLAGLLGVGGNNAAMLISYMSIASTVGRVLFGKIGDLKQVNRLLLFQVAILIIGTSTALLSLANGYAALVVYAVTFGFFDGCFIGQVAVVTSHIVGGKHLGVALGYLFGTIALPMTLGPPVAGWIYDGFQSYNVAFYVAGCTSFLGFLTMFFIPKLIKKYAEDWEKQFDFKRRASIESRRKLLSSTLSDYGQMARNSIYDTEVFAGEENTGEPLTQISVERPSFNRGRRRSLPALYVSNNSPSMRHQSNESKARLSPGVQQPMRLSAEISGLLQQVSLADNPECLSRSGSNLAPEKPHQNRMRSRRGSLPVISLPPSSQRGTAPAQLVLVDANILAQKGVPLINAGMSSMASRNKRRGSLPAVNHPNLMNPGKVIHPRVHDLGRRRGSLPLVTLSVPEKDSVSNSYGRKIKGDKTSKSKSINMQRGCSTGCIDEIDEEGHAEHKEEDVDNQRTTQKRSLSTSSDYSTTENMDGSSGSRTNLNRKESEEQCPPQLTITEVSV